MFSSFRFLKGLLSCFAFLLCALKRGGEVYKKQGPSALSAFAHNTSEIFCFMTSQHAFAYSIVWLINEDMRAQWFLTPFWKVIYWNERPWTCLVHLNSGPFRPLISDPEWWIWNWTALSNRWTKSILDMSREIRSKRVFGGVLSPLYCIVCPSIQVFVEVWMGVLGRNEWPPTSVTIG